ncbi:hypothetical protein BaRGS_00005467 [Batillaria attramentaria]|uniref:Uncharacterized protein n=1 Tax=Batillaria attramentaria TaxID=370345 RepID=A0ABD0LW73_9CAEN
MTGSGLVDSKPLRRQQPAINRHPSVIAWLPWQSTFQAAIRVQREEKVRADVCACPSCACGLTHTVAPNYHISQARGAVLVTLVK